MSWHRSRVQNLEILWLISKCVLPLYRNEFADELHQKSPRPDLITLDSPFHAEPATTLESSELHDGEDDFDAIWHAVESSCDLRGWCKLSIDTIIRRLQRFGHHRLRVIAADLPPFEGGSPFCSKLAEQ